MKAANLIANILKREGVEYFFCFPNNPVIDPAAEVGIRPIATRTERTAVSIADGYSRVSNGSKIGVVGVQCGPGAENSFGGVAQAFSDSTPILVLAGQFDQHRLGQQPNFDAVASFREITKWAARINSADRVPQLMRRAFTYLRTGRPGPVLLELPEDVANAEVDFDVSAYRPVKGARGAANPDDVRESVDALLAAKRPLIHAGQGVLYAHAWDELRELAELVQAPVMSTLPGKSVFPEDHPLSVGSGGYTGHPAAAHFLKEADLIFGIGASLTASGFAAPIPPGKVMIQATVDDRDLNKDYPDDFTLLGDARLVLQQIIDEVKRRLGSDGRSGDGSMAAAVKAIKDQTLGEWMPRFTSDEVPLNPYRVIWDLMHAVDLKNTIITHDSGNPRDQLVPFWAPVSPRGYIGWGKSSHLGWGLGLVMGAKLAAPDKLAINVMGDAAIGMVGMEIETAVRNRIAILSVVFKNSVMGHYSQSLPIATQRYGINQLSGDYMLLAKSMGAYAERVETPAEILPAFERARRSLDDGRPALLEMITKEEWALSRYW